MQPSPSRQSRSRRRVALAVALGLGLATLVACASPAPGGGSPTSAGSTPDDVDPPSPDQVYAAPVTLIQTDGADPQVCFGGVAESYPPQCGGPVVIGLDWADVADAETASGVTWGTGWVVGTYQGETFTLTEPVRSDPPDGLSGPEPWSSTDLVPLCEDPWRGGDESAIGYEEFPEGTALDEASQEAVSRLQDRAFTLPGYVELYVTDGFSEFNVLLQEGSDVEAAHASLREVWPGWLCVGTRAAPSGADATAAAEALGAALGSEIDDGAVLGYGPDTVEGTFTVWTILTDPVLREQVTRTLAPWYSADQVVFTSALVPVF